MSNFVNLWDSNETALQQANRSPLSTGPMLADQLRLLQHRLRRLLLLVGRLSVPFNYVLYDASDLSWYLLPDRLVDDQVAFNLDLYICPGYQEV